MPVVKKAKVLRPLFPNAGIEAEYRKRLDKLIKAMHDSIMYWVTTKYKNNEPLLAMDARVTAVETQVGSSQLFGGGRVWHVYVEGELLRGKNGVGRSFKTQAAAEAAGIAKAGRLAELTVAKKWSDDSRSVYEFVRDAKPIPVPADVLQEAVKTLTERWQSNFEKASERMAKHFAKAVEDRTDGAMRNILKRGGISVEFKMTPAMNDIAKATVNANVSLIRSIPQQYLRNVEGIVMRSVQSGRDLGQLSDDLQKQFGVTKRRAALIARDQNNKATSAFQRARQEELGIKKAIWMHSHAGKEPRPTHVKMDNKPYDISKGMWDKDESAWIFPGQLINCRCTSRSVVEGFS